MTTDTTGRAMQAQAAEEEQAMNDATHAGHANAKALQMARQLEHLGSRRNALRIVPDFLSEASATIAALVVQVDELEAERSTLREKLAAARKDAARLDALENGTGFCDGDIVVADCADGCLVGHADVDATVWEPVYGDNLRDAIDRWIAAERAKRAAADAGSTGSDPQ